MFYAGADLGKSFSYLTVVDEMGKVVRRGRAESTPEGLRPPSRTWGHS
jgi:hypothetical protein